MSSITYNIWRPQNVILVIGITLLINVLLFAGLPWLTRVADRDREAKKVNLTLLTPRRPPKPPESEKEKRLRREELKQAPKPKTQTRSTTRQMNMPKFGFEFGEGGFGSGIFVEFDAAGLGIDMEDFGFDVSQVDKPPRYLRKILPVYPFSAKRRGLRGWVKIQCLVTKEGLPTKIVAVDSDPADILELFGPICVAAVKKWRFYPGEIGGDPVPTRVGFKVRFQLE
jgi:protein TonB